MKKYIHVAKALKVCVHLSSVPSTQATWEEGNLSSHAACVQRYGLVYIYTCMCTYVHMSVLEPDPTGKEVWSIGWGVRVHCMCQEYVCASNGLIFSMSRKL